MSTSLSFIREQNPPYGPQEQPIAMLGMRDINQPFRYHLPQMPLFFSLASASLGLFMVARMVSAMDVLREFSAAEENRCVQGQGG
ncbi:hypothetical protein AK812_SmicGene45095 [Symbiodinium microadriaticum]|uniref:Uncharacterized protein n=1 Tax=Symbiodinium microadriaticum TaxID=2951 RepID=A0A1Q9BWW9_SYMMI|nr:hypothetical protein AK812_SmicGene45095 [Symbiodinium microadriaticum]